MHTKSSRPFILYYIVNVIEDCKIGTLRLLRIIYDVLRIGILAQKVCIYIRFLTKLVDDSKDTCQNFALLASQKFPEMWHRPFNLYSYMNFRGVITFAVEVWSWKLFQI